MVPGLACTPDVLKVRLKVKGHMVWALLSCHKNCFSSRANGLIVTKLASDGPQTVLHPGCAQGQAQGQRSHGMGTFVISRKSLLLVRKLLDCHQTFTRWSPDRPASRMCTRSRSKVTSYGHFHHVPKMALSRAQIARSPPNLHAMVPGWACTHGVLKVKLNVKGHVIRAVLSCTADRMPPSPISILGDRRLDG